jgi:hypothetical protein
MWGGPSWSPALPRWQTLARSHPPPSGRPQGSSPPLPTALAPTDVDGLVLRMDAYWTTLAVVLFGLACCYLESIAL